MNEKRIVDMLAELDDDHGWWLDDYSETDNTDIDDDFTFNVRHLFLKVCEVYIIKILYSIINA